MAKGWLVIRLMCLLLPLLSMPAFSSPWWVGANVKQSTSAPWGSDAAMQSMQRLATAGAEKALLIAFIWQESTGSNHPVIGHDSQLETIQAGLRQIRESGLVPVLKIHLWIPNHWAGDAKPTDPAVWFLAYQNALQGMAREAERAGVKELVMGTELRGLEEEAQWPALVSTIRQSYSGKLFYVTDSLERAEQFRYWSLFDAVATSLYPALNEDPRQRREIMHSIGRRLQVLAAKWQRPAWVAEVGMRSSQDSLLTPWESPEQRQGHVDLAIQQGVLEEWHDALRQSGISAMALWCWYTDPHAGGPADTDFTVQNKPAQSIFLRSEAHDRPPQEHPATEGRLSIRPAVDNGHLPVCSGLSAAAAGADRKSVV